jgi:hypothetical protein
MSAAPATAGTAAGAAPRTLSKLEKNILEICRSHETGRGDNDLREALGYETTTLERANAYVTASARWWTRNAARRKLGPRADTLSMNVAYSRAGRFLFLSGTIDCCSLDAFI